MPKEKKIKPIPPAPPEEGETEPAPRVEGLSNGAPAPPTAAPAAAKPIIEKEKIVVTLDGSGGLDVGAMREKTRDRLIAALKRSHSDLLPKAPTAPPIRLPDEAVAAIFNMIGVAETVLASRNFPPAVAAQVFMWRPDEVAIMQEPTQALFAKYAPNMARWKEETAFALCFAQVHFQKKHMLDQMMIQYRESQRQAAEANRQAPPKPAEPAGEPPLPDGIERMQ